jgi:hypothetical protein
MHTPIDMDSTRHGEGIGARVANMRRGYFVADSSAVLRVFVDIAIESLDL